jgi:stage II sporulation protein D
MPTQSPTFSRLAALAAAASLLAAGLAPGQDTRPRRVPQPNEPAPRADAPAQAPTRRPAPATPSATPAASDAPRATPSPADSTPPDDAPDFTRHDDAPGFVRLEAEPSVRIGLATGARSATVSTSGQLLVVSDEFGREAAPRPVAVARIRIEPRVLAPLPANGGADQLASNGAGDAGDAARGSSSGAARGTSRAAPPKQGASGSSRPGASAARGAGRQGGVQRVSRAADASRGLVVYSTGASQLLNSRAPLTFATADEQAAPLRFNERPYRGRIEVFTSPNGTLTVVNVVRLEDYVRGVVANELSPGVYPAVEALKAQAVAARTYAVSNRGQFRAAGFDLLPTVRSQVYGGRSTEHALTDRAVAETRGVVATYAGRPINALYTSTCGGHTEDAEKIFGGDPVPYLRGRACAVELHQQASARAPNTIQTTREPVLVRDAERARGPRDAALLAVHGFPAPARVTDDWLSDDIEPAELRALLALSARLARRPAPAVPPGEVPTRPPAFASALAIAIDGESRADVLLDAATVNYLLDFRDASDIPARNRADVALLLRDGHLTLLPDASLRPRQQLTRSRALRAAASLLEARGLLQTQKATARPSDSASLVIRPARGGERALTVAPDAHLFRAFGEDLFAVRSVRLVGGEPVQFHTDARGAVDYLEVRPAPGGASAERFSPHTNWTAELTPARVAERLARYGRVGEVVDLRVASRGVSRRVLDLEVVGTTGTAHVRGGRIRSALGLKEQLFFVEPRRDETGRAVAFVFTGRGWGHGVGLCQVGAYGLARAGLTHEQILKHYYTGIELSRLY